MNPVEEEEESFVSGLPWCWVIEALARSQLIDLVLFSELLSNAPPLSGDVGKEVMEAAALRCLEGFLCPRNESRDDLSASHGSKIEFDPAESCVDVLKRILHEKEESNDLKWDVQSFVDHKKASLPRPTLELLKNTILEGGHPLAASLKEISGPAILDQYVLNIPSHGGDPTSPPPRSDENGHGNGAVLAEENRGPLSPGIHDQFVRANFRNGNTPHSKRNTSPCCIDNNVQETDDTLCDMDNHGPPGKKPKLDGEYDMQSKPQHSVPFGGSKLSNGNEEEQNHEFLKANGTHDGKSYTEHVADQAKMYVQNHDQPQTTSNNGDNHCEEINFSMKKPSLLSSQYLSSEDFLKMTETEPNHCMKCGEGGQLLTCSTSTCPLLFHESCLGCSASIDDQGNFYCPFCAYSRAISEYVRAKEKLSLARKELSLFIGGRTSHQLDNDPERPSGEKVNQQRHENVDKTAELKNGANVVTEVAKSPSKQEFERQGAENIQLARDVPGTQNEAQDDHGSDSAKLSGGKKKLTNESSLERKQENTGHRVTELHGATSSDSICNSDGEDERNNDTTSLPCPRPLRAIPATPRVKRKRVPWTAEEEAMLKKGVQTLVHGGDKAIPWRKVLEFGSSVFQKGRTAIDLKDKWRNIMRGGSPKIK